MNVMVYPCILRVALLMDQFVLCVACLTVFVNCLVKQLAIYLGVVWVQSTSLSTIRKII